MVDEVSLPEANERSLPKTYKQLVARQVGQSFREVAEVMSCPTEQPSTSEVLVKIHFAGINGGCETFRARGDYVFAGNKGKKNFRLGAEAVGVIAAIGTDVHDLRVGQSVAVSGAGYGEYVISKAAMCFPIREASAEAVAVSLSGLTAAGALLYKGNIKAGETVMVTAAAGGTGHFAVQIAKLKGCTVVATAGSPEKAAMLQELGADRVINYRQEDVGAVLASEFSQKVDVAYEGVGGPLRNAVLENLAPAGRMLAVGYISEYPHNKQQSGNTSAPPDGWDLPPADKLMWESMTIKNGDQTLFGQVWPQDRQQITEARQWLFEQFYGGRITAWVDKVPFCGLDSIVDATEHMLSGNSTGKVVVDLR